MNDLELQKLLMRAFKKQEHTASGSCLWKFVGVVKLHYSDWDETFATTTINDCVTQSLGGWEKWRRAWASFDTRTYGDVEVDTILYELQNAWRRYKLGIGSLLKTAHEYARSHPFRLTSPLFPMINASPENRYHEFVRTLTYVTLLLGSSKFQLAQKIISSEMKTNKNTTYKWVSWAVGDRFFKKLDSHVFKGARHPENKAAEYRVSPQLRKTARLTCPGLGHRRPKDSLRITPHKEDSVVFNRDSSFLGVEPRKLKPDIVVFRGKRIKMHPRWMEMALLLEKTVARGKGPNKNLWGSARAFRMLHLLGGGELREKPSVEELWRHLKAYCQEVEAIGDYRDLPPDGPACGSGTTFRKKWDKVRGFYKRLHKSRGEEVPEPKRKKIVTIKGDEMDVRFVDGKGK